jgi:4a-hydroxytetrahydrobiopterin dehydratase
MKLTDTEIAHELTTLPGWSRTGDAITKTFKFANFPEAVAFVDDIVPVAEAMDHHPDLDIRYNKVIVTLSTHDAGGITGKDVAQAREMEAVAG